MQIVEVKNNLVKVSYDTVQENLVLSGFVVIKDSVNSFIGQIIHLDANHKGTFAVIKLLFLFDENGVITNYNGSIPDPRNSLLDTVQPSELLELLPVQNPILLGELAQQNTLLKLDRVFLEENVLVCCEKEEDNKVLVENLSKQLISGDKKVLVIDLIGDLDFSYNKIIASDDFKLPLNYETINFIYEKGLDDANAETKALIQEVFLEVQNYVKTLPEKFIPFESFKNVVDAQYQETDLIELVLLKNKLLKYYEAGIFAQDKNEFDSLKTSLQKQNTTILDLSNVDHKIQREMISYTYSLINELDEKIYVICNIDNENSDKKLLKQIFMSKAYSTLICSYSYKYLKELKQLSKNLILFAPIQQQNDFAGYNTFLNKLNSHEFIIYGKSTNYFPLIVKLEAIKEEAIGNLPDEQEQVYFEEQPSQEDLLDEQIRRDVDEIYTAPKAPQQEDFNEEVSEDELTEEDLDFIDDLGGVNALALDDERSYHDEERIDTLSIGAGSENEITENENEDFIPDIEIEEKVPEYSEQETNEGFDEFPNEELIEENIIEEPEEIPDFSQIEEEIEEEPIENEAAETFSNVLNQQAQEQEEPPAIDILPVKMVSTPIVPIYSAEVEPKAQSDELEQGDIVTHPKYGKGTVEKLISYGSKTLCSINFDNIGRRLLDPTLVELKKAT